MWQNPNRQKNRFGLTDRELAVLHGIIRGDRDREIAVHLGVSHSAVRESGARIKFISDGDVAGAIMAAKAGTGIDLLLGIGGTPEGIIAASALTCMGGAIQGRLWPRDEDERRKALDAGHDLGRVLHTNDLVAGEDVFFCATGITDGELAAGVRYDRGGVYTSSIVMRSKSGTIRNVESVHQLSKLRAYAAVDFDRN